MKNLKSLDEHNSQQLKVYWNRSLPQLNGIACPDCGEELYDSKPMEVLMSYPPKKNTNCSKCGYAGYRIV